MMKMAWRLAGVAGVLLLGAVTATPANAALRVSPISTRTVAYGCTADGHCAEVAAILQYAPDTHSHRAIGTVTCFHGFTLERCVRVTGVLHLHADDQIVILASAGCGQAPPVICSDETNHSRTPWRADLEGESGYESMIEVRVQVAGGGVLDLMTIAPPVMSAGS